MAKLPRKTQKIFCSKPTSENQTSVFGTMKTADKQYSTDVGTLQSNAAYEQGWKSATIASYKPFMEDFNTLNYINTSQLAYLFQQGIPEWDEATAYYKNSFCSYNGDLWKSLIDDNLNNTPLEGESWTLFTSGKKSGSGLELCDIGMALYVDETKGLRRYLNGQIVDINTNTQAFLNRLLQIQATNPEYFTTEDNWQAEATLNIDGCVYKFVLNYDSTGTNVVSVRLPKYPDYVEVSAGSTATTAPIKELGLVPQQGYGITEGGMYWIPAKLTNVGSTDKVNASCKLLSQDGSGAVWLGEIKSGAKGNYFSGYADLSGLNIKQTKLKLRYFIQIATGSETENNIVNEIELNNPYVLFKSEYFEAPPYNLSWLKSDGEYKPKATYIKAYEALVVENNSSIAVGTTVDLPSGTKYTKRGLSVKLSTASDITDYDFVLNTAEETFRLPLKNHTSDDGNNKLSLYYYVGETVQNANLINAGRIGEQLATKASVDDIDGAFVKSVLVLVGGTTYTVGTTHETKTLVQFDISNYLPEDSNEYDYEVRLSSEGYTITNTSVMLWIDIPSVADISQAWTDQQTTSCGSVGSVVTQIIPKGYKKASIYLRSSSSSMQFYSHIVGYRRLRKGA